MWNFKRFLDQDYLPLLYRSKRDGASAGILFHLNQNIGVNLILLVRKEK